MLAPMAGVTDTAFRGLCAEQGAALVYTEMVSAKALCYNDKKTASLLHIPDDSVPVSAQIFGHEPESMAEGAKRALDICGADIIDINMGCPVGKVVKSGDGSALMRTPELAAEIVAAVAGAVSVPVTVKIRKGWDGGSVNAAEVAKLCEEAGASAIAVHGRTRVQMYSGRADWDIIRDVKRAVTVPVIANGDVFSGEDAVRILRYTGADALMVGRGSFGDPWLFREINAVLDGEPVPERPCLEERMDTAVRQVETAALVKGERLACVEARARLPWYLKGVPHSAAWKQKLVRISTLEELRGIAADIAKGRPPMDIIL